MRIDFINDGSHDVPLIRLFSCEKDEIELLRLNILKLGNNESDKVIVSDLPISASKQRLTFKLNEKDKGIGMSKDKRDFVVELCSESWLEMAEKLKPFLANQEGFAWLYDSMPLHMLFTTDGYW